MSFILIKNKQKTKIICLTIERHLHNKLWHKIINNKIYIITFKIYINRHYICSNDLYLKKSNKNCHKFIGAII